MNSLSESEHSGFTRMTADSSGRGEAKKEHFDQMRPFCLAPAVKRSFSDFVGTDGISADFLACLGGFFVYNVC
jgi:hypothetical protein